MTNGGKREGAGRPKGAKASHTLQVEKARAEFIRMYLEKIKPINEALLAKAEAGDIQAIKELHDRVYGRPAQPLVGDKDNPIVIEGINISVRK